MPIMHYERSYSTARALFSFLEFMSWFVVVAGGFGAIIGLSTGGLSAFVTGHVTVTTRIISMIPGIIVIFVGLIGVAFVQFGRATVDTAEMTRELLKLAQTPPPPGKVERDASDKPSLPKTHEHAKSEPAKRPPKPSAPKTYERLRSETPEEPAKPFSPKTYAYVKAETQKDLSPGEQALVETYKGVEIYLRYNGHYIGEQWFAGLKAAKSFVDSSERGKEV